MAVIISLHKSCVVKMMLWNIPLELLSATSLSLDPSEHEIFLLLHLQFLSSVKCQDAVKSKHCNTCSSAKCLIYCKEACSLTSVISAGCMSSRERERACYRGYIARHRWPWSLCKPQNKAGEQKMWPSGNGIARSASIHTEHACAAIIQNAVSINEDDEHNKTLKRVLT